jgi:hypothetical protein
VTIWDKLFHKKTIKQQSEEGSLSKTEEELEEDPEEEESDFELYKESKEETPEVDDAREEYEVVEREILPAKIICPDCGGITLEGLEFCDKCGGELQ